MALAAMTIKGTGSRAFLAAFCILAGAVSLSGCVQSTASSNRAGAAQPLLAAAPPATGEPVVLSGVAYTEADVAANPKPVGPSEADIIKPARANQAVATAPLPGAPPEPTFAAAPVRPNPPPVVAAVPSRTEPLPGFAAAPPPPPPVVPKAAQVISAPSPVGVTPTMPTITTMGQVTGPVLDEKGFPNINAPPRQPTGQLLSADERARLIAELNALAGRPTQ